MPDVHFEKIFKRFGSLRLFEGLNLRCPSQTYMCLLGPSGCGKTTLMRMVAGLEEPDGGDILVDGRRINDFPPAARDVGMAFQNYALYPHLTVAENLAFPLRAPIRRRQFSDEDIHDRVNRIADLLKIDWLLDRSVNALSGGQQQRVSLGRSLIRGPSILLLDEPVTHLDARLRYEMRAELKTIHRRLGTTTIHVTHDQQEALAVADLIALMRDGAIVQICAPLEVYDNPANTFVAGFIGDPPMSLLHAELRRTDVHLDAVIGEARLPLPADFAKTAETAGDAVTIGLRPAHLRLASEPGADVLAGTVYSHEMVGREQELMLSVGDSLVRFRTEQPKHVSVGDTFRVHCSFEGARLFDRKTGKALSPS